LISISGNVFTYRIDGYVNTGDTYATIIDIASWAWFSDDFVMTVSQGTGTLFVTQIADDGINERIMQVTNQWSGLTIFSITYTTLANRYGAWTPTPICNEATFSTPILALWQEQICACPEGRDYCSDQDICVPEGTPCGFDKRIISVVGDQITYMIEGSIVSGVNQATIVDTLSGATYNNDFVLSTTNGSGTLQVTGIGDARTLTVNKTTGTDVWFGITYSVTATWIFYQSGGVDFCLNPTPICNTITISAGGATGVDGTCACPTWLTYCPGTNICIGSETPCDAAWSVCADFNVTPLTITGSIYSGTYQCMGSGINYVVDVYSGNELIAIYTWASGNINLAWSWTYTAYCRVDGDTGVMCNGQALSLDQIFVLVGQIGGALDTVSSGYVGAVNRGGLLYAVDVEEFIDIDEHTLIGELQVDAYAYFIAQMIQLYPPIPGGVYPNIQLSVLQQAQQQIYGIVQQEIMARCTEMCRQTISVWGGSGSGGLCQDIIASGAVTVTNQQAHAVDFTCVAALPGLQTVLSCGNATTGETIYTGISISLGSGWYGMVWTCAYTWYATYTATCTVAGTTNNDCVQNVLLRQTSWPPSSIACGNGVLDPWEQCEQGIPCSLAWSSCVSCRCVVPPVSTYCGDGILQAPNSSGQMEQCDDGNANNDDGCRNNCTLPWGNNSSSSTTSTSTTSTSTTPSSTTPWWSSGGGGWWWGGTPSSLCAKWGIIDAKYCVDNEPRCSEIDPPSVMQGEYLPFWWDLELGNEVDLAATSCATLRTGKTIPGSSLLCTFELYNGATRQEIATIENVPCTRDRWNEQGVQLFDDFKDLSSAHRLWSSWIQLTEHLTKGIVGEYQIVLSEVAYETCEWGNSSQRIYKGVSDERVCAMNFSVADGYLIHQGTSLSILADTNLRMFRKVDGRAVLSRDTLRRVQQSLTAIYPGDEVKKIITKRAEQQSSRASQTAQLVAYTNNLVNKVPNQRIYVYDGGEARAPFMLRDGKWTDMPMTIIVRNADVVVEWSLAWRHMYLVPEGTVTFQNMNCDEKDIVQGIWMSAWGFATNRMRNDRLGERNWCADWRLVIDGMVVGPWLDPSFVDARRAVLTDWFDVTFVSQEQKVFDAASVLLKTDPKTWSQLPPGADAFIRQLSVRR
jgi:cysteine-rich repeat protein